MADGVDFEVVVLGAGPCGASAAYDLARSGITVLVVDRVEFPRVKPCGGGVTIKTLNLMPYSIAPVIERATKAVNMGVKTPTDGRSEVFESNAHICTFVVRSKFDKFNFDKVIEAGVEFLVDGTLCAIDEHSNRVEISFESRK